MISKQHSHYLQFLAQNHNILLLSNKNYEAYSNMHDYFNNAVQRNMQDIELENINITLMTNEIEIVILDTTDDVIQARKFCDAVSEYSDRIVILSVLNKNCSVNIMDLIELSDSVIFDTFGKEELKGKLVEMLSVFYAVLSIGRRDVSLKSGLSNINEIGIFLDTYEGSSLFIVDELIELNQKLKDGELSKELLDEIGKKCFEIAGIFSKNTLLSRVSPTFESLGYFLIGIDFSTIEPSGLKAFDYLSNIIDDLNKNLMDMFVDRIFQDVYIFEHSLENNIEFMKLNLFPNENKDTSELDFF